MVTQNRNIGHNGVARLLGGDVRMPDIPQAGVCIVRAEVQGDHVLITITASTSSTRTLRSMYSSQPRRFVDITKALDAVAEFLQGFVVGARDDGS